MSNGVGKTNSHSERPLRFALYGRAHAGKTCYLAALAIEQRVGNPRGYTSDWIYSPDICPAPPVGCESIEDMSRWLAGLSDVEAQFARGKIWLDRAKNAMCHGEIQPPNDIAAMHRYRFVFRGKPFTPPSTGENGEKSPVRPRNYQIELVDYSGELTDPQLRDEDFVKRVRDHLRECDGLIVLAEAPHSVQSMAEQYQNFSRLRVAFESIRKSKFNAGELCPVALVVNKGDRLMPGDRYDPALADARLVSFFASEPEPPHRQLQEVLRSAVSPDRYRAFLASAFGKSRTIQTQSKSGVVIPEDVPEFDQVLKSYGLEDPFIWLASQHERIAMERLDKGFKGLLPWKFWQLADKSHPNFTKDANEVLSSTKDSAEAQGRARDLLTKSRTIATQQAGVLLLVVALVIAVLTEGVTALVDRGALVAANPMPTSIPEFPTSSENITLMKSAIAWYAGYKAPSWRRVYSHSFLLSVNGAETRIKELSDRLMLEDIAKNIKAATSEQSLNAVAKRVSELANDSLSDSSRGIVGNLTSLLVTQKQANTKRLADETFHNEYGQAKKNLDLLQQALVLNKRWDSLSESGQAELKQVREEFKQSLPASLRTKVEQFLMMEDWPGALTQVNQVATSADVKALQVDEGTLSEVRRKLDHEIYRKWEKYYYAKIVEAPGIPAATQAVQQYVDKVPPEAVSERCRAKVEEYGRYLERFSREMKYKVRLVSIYWGTAPSDWKTHLSVNINGADVIPDVLTKTKSNDTTTFDDIGEITGTLNSDLKISAISIVKADGAMMGRRGPWGTINQTVPLIDLTKTDGVTLNLTNPDYKQRLCLHIVDCPNPLPLPSYDMLAGQ